MLSAVEKKSERTFEHEGAVIQSKCVLDDDSCVQCRGVAGVSNDAGTLLV